MSSKNAELDNVNQFLEEINKHKVQNSNANISFISNIDWNFMNNLNDREIEIIISSYSEFLMNILQDPGMVPKVCEIIMKYLYVLPKGVRNIKSYQPFIFLIWNLYFSNTFLKNDLQIVISHIFPHYLGASFENVSGYIENLLNLISLYLNSEDGSLYSKYLECNHFFIKDMQYFIIEEIINYIVEFDGRLVLKDLEKSEIERPKEIGVQVNKLDKIMCLFFNFCEKNSFNKDNELNWSHAEDLFKKLKRIYKNKILMYQMQNSLFHVHYTLAYLTSFHPSFSKHFCEYLWTLATDEDQSLSIRCAANKNLVGYVSKFNFISAGFAIEILSEMFGWCNNYINQLYSLDSHQNKHDIFYCIANGALLILLFRHEEMLNYFGSVSNFSAHADVWQLSDMTMHSSNILKEFPYREQLGNLCKLFKEYYLGFIDTIVKERILRLPKPKLMLGIPFRYYFLKDSMDKLKKYRVSGEKHFLDE